MTAQLCPQAVGITTAQTRVLLAVAHLEMVGGVAVTVRAIQGLLGYGSPVSPWAQLVRLERAGMVERWAFGGATRWRSRYRIVAQG